MIDLNTITVEEVERRIDAGKHKKLLRAIRKEQYAGRDVCRAKVLSRKSLVVLGCTRDANHEGIHIATGSEEVFAACDPTPAPVGVPAGLAVSIAQALLTAAENMPEDGEIVCESVYDFVSKVLSCHPEGVTIGFHEVTIEEIETGEYGAGKLTKAQDAPKKYALKVYFADEREWKVVARFNSDDLTLALVEEGEDAAH